MRILFTFTGGSGHLDPLVPVARAAESAGHTVAFAGRPSILSSVQAQGFTVLATEPAEDGTPKRIPLQPPDAEREDRDLREGFADRIARERAAAVHTLCAEWQPQLIVCDEIDFGSMIAAERLGLPYASVLVGAPGFVRGAVVGEPLNAVRAEHGLPPDPDLAMLRRHLVLSPFPPSYRDPRAPLPATGHLLRSIDVADREETTPEWIAGLFGTPTVYFTLGTVFNLESGDLFARVIAGLRDLPINLVVTVGRDIDPEELGPLPANVHVERYISHAVLLPHCDLVVCHGGSGTLIGALAHGLPMVLIPMGADQLLNAARCEELGLARVLDAVRVTPETARDAVAGVLADPTHRRVAERMRDEIAAMPGPDHAVTLLEELARRRRPPLSS